MKKFLTTIGLLFIVGVAAAIAFGCCNNQQAVNNWKNIVNSGEETRQLKEQLENQENELRILAREAGISESKINSMSTSGLITEIRIRLSDSQYVGTTLSEDELNYISDVCVDDQDVIKKIKNYDNFIKRTKQQNEAN